MGHRKEKWLDRASRRAEEQIRELGLELSFAPVYNTYVWKSPFGRFVIVGYLATDDACEDPISSCEGLGTIIAKDRSAQHYAELGLDHHGYPIIEDQEAYLCRLKGVDVGEVDVADDAFELWKAMFERGKIGTQYAKPLKDLHRGGYCEADIEDVVCGLFDAAWVPDKALKEHLDTIDETKRQDEAVLAFNDALETFNRWAEGDCYGVIIDVFVKDGLGEYELLPTVSDQCWGYVGGDFAEESLHDELTYARAQCLKGRTTKR
jgi:hypothetical protein